MALQDSLRREALDHNVKKLKGEGFTHKKAVAAALNYAKQTAKARARKRKRT